MHSVQALKIIELRQQGASIKKIQKLLKCSRSTVSKWCCTLSENESIKNNLNKIRVKILTDDIIKQKELNLIRQINIKSKNDIKKLIRDSVKTWAIYKLGGKCRICGYNKCMASMTFHHVNKTTKLFNICGMALTHNIFRIIDELNKCVLMCHNCHTELHNGFDYELTPIKITHEEKPESIILWCVENKMIDIDKYTMNNGQKYTEINVALP
jgi:hypothetical protein